MWGNRKNCCWLHSWKRREDQGSGEARSNCLGKCVKEVSWFWLKPWQEESSCIQSTIRQWKVFIGVFCLFACFCIQQASHFRGGEELFLYHRGLTDETRIVTGNPNFQYLLCFHFFLTCPTHILITVKPSINCNWDSCGTDRLSFKFKKSLITPPSPNIHHPAKHSKSRKLQRLDYVKKIHSKWKQELLSG